MIGIGNIPRQVREFAEKRSDLKWIEVEGWNYSAFPDGTLPSAKDLDGVTGGRPAFLVAYDYHTIWMNREALKEVGISVRWLAESLSGKESRRALASLFYFSRGTELGIVHVLINKDLVRLGDRNFTVVPSIVDLRGFIHVRFGP